MHPASPALVARATSDVGFKGDKITNFYLGHSFPNRYNLTSRFVSHYAWDFFHVLSHPR
jgi:hypothetical protein